MRVIHNLQAALVHWVYTQEEWKAYRRWEQSRRSPLHSVLFRLFRQQIVSVPEITITGQKVWIDNISQVFMDQQRQLKRVNIREMGSMNILVIIYACMEQNRERVSEIRVPVPTGKLKEAVIVQESLAGYTV